MAVSIAYGLWLAAAACGVGAALVMLLELGALEASVRAVAERNYPDESPVTRDRAAALAAAVLIGAGFVVGLGQAGSAMAMRSGRGAARVLLVLLLAASVIDVLLALGVVSTGVRIAMLLSVAFGLVGAVMMYLPAVNLWLGAQHR